MLVPSVQLIFYGLEGSAFESGQRHGNNLLSKKTRHAVGSTQAPIQCVPRFPSLGGRAAEP